MKLCSYRIADQERLGVVLDSLDSVLDVAVAARSAGEQLPGTMNGFLQTPEAGQRLERVVQWAHSRPVEELRGQQLLLPMGRLTWLPAVPHPPKILCIGLNYWDHCRETGQQPPQHPVLFAKYTNTLLAHGDAIPLPKTSQQVDYEAELCVVIGQRAKEIPVEHALSVVAGYTICNDLSARDLQFGDGQWTRGKTQDGFFPVGPYLVTADEVGDPQHLSIRLTRNGETMQQSNTSEMIFSVAAIISFLSEGITLEPGDLIATGTPAGVGMSRKPPVFLQDGDEIGIEILGLGRLTNHVRAG
ncbi:MAG: fumarylacetoacetate hydrolase family protein [Firmicutes bacterium]|nr:fumarylacetoacetate hydrolase family protein [Bacillota bacterium]